MIQDISPKKFHIEYQNIYPRQEDVILVYRDRLTLLKRNGNEIEYPTKQQFDGAEMDYIYLFRIDEEKYFLGLPKDDGILHELLNSGYTFEKTWSFRETQPLDRAFAGVTGLQLEDWYRSHRICGECGEELVADDSERMMHCPKCGRSYYPIICPGVIVAVVHNGRLLMSKYNGREYKRFALIAGFTETGESIEDTVHREVMEEVGLKVKNLKFYKSQPWSFSNTLLMGFFCELDGDDETITLEEDELSEAGWYTPEEVPEDFEHISLTSEMMTVFKEAGGQVY